MVLNFNAGGIVLAHLMHVVVFFSTGNSKVFMSDDCLKILVVLNGCLFYLWLMDADESVNNPRVTALSGRWIQINVPDTIPVPSSDCLEAAFSALFYSSQVGYIIQLTF